MTGVAAPERAQPRRDYIVCVDDEEGILSALRQQLAMRFGDECVIEVAQSGADALELLDELTRDREEVALVIADQIMPGMKGVELLEEVHRRSPTTTKILLTGQAGLDAVVTAINRAGLNRYIPKPWDEPDLRLSVEDLLKTYRLRRENQQLVEDLTSKNRALADANAELAEAKRALEHKVRERTRALEEANLRLEQLAITDGLTGIYNHRYFQDALRAAVERASRTGADVALLMVDVDHFKRFNDEHGHPAGDAVLRRVAQLLREDRRQVDTVARYGGEEFALILEGVGLPGGLEVAERIRQRVGLAPVELPAPGAAVAVTVSVGVAVSPLHGRTPSHLLHCADEALYRAKRGGRNRVEPAQIDARLQQSEGAAAPGAQRGERLATTVEGVSERKEES